MQKRESKHIQHLTISLCGSIHPLKNKKLKYISGKESIDGLLKTFFSGIFLLRGLCCLNWRDLMTPCDILTTTPCDRLSTSDILITSDCQT